MGPHGNQEERGAGDGRRHPDAITKGRTNASQIEQVAPAVDDTDDLSVVIDQTIESHVIADDAASEPGPNIVAGRPKPGMINGPGTDVIDAVEQHIGGRRVIRRDVLPNLDQILPRPQRAKKASSTL